MHDPIEESFLIEEMKANYEDIYLFYESQNKNHDKIDAITL